MLRTRAFPKRPHRPSLVGDESGVATIEFAVLVPLLIALIFAAAEYVNAIDNRNKVAALARTLADLTSQGDATSPISASLMTQIMGAADPVLAPFPASQATAKIAAVGVYSVGGKQVPHICSAWPPQSEAERLVASEKLTVPSVYDRNGARFIVAQVSMPYQPLFAAYLDRFLGPLDLSFTWNESVTWPVRGGVPGASAEPEVTLPGGVNCPPKL